MTKESRKQLWLNGPRILMVIVFTIALISKLINPGAFFIMTDVLSMPHYTPEILLSLLITTETLMIFLLVKHPDTGILWSAFLLLLFTAVIAILQAIGIHELCGCFG